MSFRFLSHRLAQHGRHFLQSYCKREIYTNILGHTNKSRIPATITRAGNDTIKETLNTYHRSGIFRFGQHARRLFVDNILNRVTAPYSEELRNKATKKLFYGDSAPFFALIGVSLASGTGVLTKEDELEGVCREIREAANRLQTSWNYGEVSKVMDDDFNIDKLDVGPPIAKGCAAVVYAASLKTANVPENSVLSAVDNTEIKTQSNLLQKSSLRPEMMSPIQNISRFVHNFGGSADNLNFCNQSAAIEEFIRNEAVKTQEYSTQFFGMSTGCSKLAGKGEEVHNVEPVHSAHINRYPLAMKMMFNYDIQSNAMAILRAMYKETVPARRRALNESSEEWEKLITDQTYALPPHPNIVLMFGYFCGEVRNFRDGNKLYPIAQPPRINPQGYGRNMSLYLLMKRYDYSLRDLLDTNKLNTRTKLLLFTQLLEAVTHINRHGIAHRDLKSDNILIEKNDDGTSPILVLSDFGCCLADKSHGLQIPYTSFDIDKGGNAALMAPEIINKRPGTFSVLNYSKSDLWACGAIAYEIFGMNNPFYSTSEIAIGHKENATLKNIDYKEIDLPKLIDECPYIVQQLIYNVLNPNPTKRVSPDVAANIMQLFLWAPSSWLKDGAMPSSSEVLQWLLSLTTKCICEGRIQEDDFSFKNGRRTFVEYLLICSFLARVRLHRIRRALSWIQRII